VKSRAKDANQRIRQETLSFNGMQQARSRLFQKGNNLIALDGGETVEELIYRVSGLQIVE
jgi:hypothetical protein